MRGTIRDIFGSLMFVLFPVVFLCAVGWLAVRDWRIALTRMPVTAVVVSREGASPDAADRVTVTYRYEVAGRSYTGTLAAGEDSKSDLKRLGRLSPGDEIPVLYDPSNPAVSGERPRGLMTLLGILLFLIPFEVIGVSEFRKAITGRPILKETSFAGGGGPGGPGFLVFTLLCCFGGLGYAGWAHGQPLAKAVPVGLVFAGGVVPGASLLVHRLWRRGRERAAAAPRRAYSTGRVVTAILAAVFCSAITGLFAGFAGWAIVKALRAQARFVATSGVVTFSDVKVHSDSDGTTVKPLAKYRYEVGGRQYIGSEIAYGLGSTNLGSDARRFVDAHPPGTQVTVYYNPGDPGESVLQREVSGFAVMLALFIQPFIIISIALVVMAVTLPFTLRRVDAFLAGAFGLPWQIPNWGMLREDTGGPGIRGRPGVMLTMALGFMLPCFFGSIWAFLAGSVGGAGLGFFTRCIALSAAVAVVTGFLAARQPRLHLRVDTAGRRLILNSPRHQFDAGFDEIAEWVVRGIPDPRLIAFMGHRMTVPMLVVRTADGREAPVHVFGTQDYAFDVARKVAETFAQLTGAAAGSRKKHRERDSLGGPTTRLGGLIQAYRRAREYADLI